MRLRSLSLSRFGPFTDTVLDFSAGPQALNVVFGANEAGKSTALRAITGLLFGIPEKTRDTHTHPTQELRIGGQLIARDGREIEVWRRKGRKNTLLAATGEPLAEDALAPFLAGVGAQGFELGFGLDAARLRQGAEALLGGEGAVGQILFDAATGGASVERVLVELEARADALFKPRAKKARINAALADYKVAKDKLRDRIHLPEAWQRQQAALDAVQKERADLEAKRQLLAREQLKLDRARHALPQLARYRAFGLELEQMGPVPALDPGVRAERERITKQLGEVRSAIAPVARRLEVLRKRRDEQVVADALVAIDAAVIRELSERLGSQRTARSDLPKLRARLEEHEREAERIARRLGATTDEARERFRLTTAQSARIQELCTNRPADAAELSADLERREARCRAAAERLEKLPSARDTSELGSVLGRARKAGDLPGRIRELDHEIAARARHAARRLASHAPYQGDLPGVLSVALPAAETVERFVAEHAAAVSERDRLERDRKQVEDRLRAVGQELEALVREGDVPTVEDLTRVRARRDEGWQIVRRGLRGEAIAEAAAEFDADLELADAFEAAQQGADMVADRLRREAGVVARWARLQAERDGQREELAALEAREGELAKRREELDASWRAAWRPAGLLPLSPPEMRGFDERHAQLAELAEKQAEARDRRAALEADQRALERELRAPLAQHSELADAELLELVDIAEAELEAAAQADRERRERERELESETRELGVERERVARLGGQLESWRAAFGRAVEPLGFSADTSPTEVLAVLVEARELFVKLEHAEAVRSRIQGIQRDTLAFERDLRTLLEAAAPHWLSLDAEVAAERLVSAHQEAFKAHEAKQRLEREVRESEEELGLLRAQAEGLADTLAELLKRASASTTEELIAMEERAERLRSLTEQRQAIERDLSEASDGLGVTELEHDLAGVELDDAKLRLSAIKNELEHLDEEREALLGDIANLEQALRRFESTEGEEAALDLEAKAAEVHADVERYVRLNLAIAVLSQEIERYRQENQGPVLERAGELFRGLTHDRYVGLVAEVGSGDRVVLHATRADEKAVELDGLSDGARDQLYLALRLATLERHARNAEPLPLVLDDVLTSFDEERTSAALSVLAEVAKTTQVLLFTHHAHLVKLAREAVAADRLAVHELSRVGPGSGLRALA